MCRLICTKIQNPPKIPSTFFHIFAQPLVFCFQVSLRLTNLYFVEFFFPRKYRQFSDPLSLECLKRCTDQTYIVAAITSWLGFERMREWRCQHGGSGLLGRRGRRGGSGGGALLEATNNILLIGATQWTQPPSKQTNRLEKLLVACVKCVILSVTRRGKYFGDDLK